MITIQFDVSELSFIFFLSQTIQVITEVGCAIFYTHQTIGACAGMCACNCTNQMEKTGLS